MSEINAIMTNLLECKLQVNANDNRINTQLHPKTTRIQIPFDVRSTIQVRYSDSHCIMEKPLFYNSNSNPNPNSIVIIL